jgi:hypothetical protein
MEIGQSVIQDDFARFLLIVPIVNHQVAIRKSRKLVDAADGHLRKTESSLSGPLATSLADL